MVLILEEPLSCEGVLCLRVWTSLPVRWEVVARFGACATWNHQLAPGKVVMVQLPIPLEPHQETPFPLGRHEVLICILKKKTRGKT